MVERIEINPRVCNGHPVIRGTRIPVTVILSYLSAGKTWDDIRRGFPELTDDDIRAVLDFAREMIEQTEIVFSEAR